MVSGMRPPGSELITRVLTYLNLDQSFFRAASQVFWPDTVRLDRRPWLLICPEKAARWRPGKSMPIRQQYSALSMPSCLQCDSVTTIRFCLEKTALLHVNARNQSTVIVDAWVSILPRLKALDAQPIILSPCRNLPEVYSACSALN